MLSAALISSLKEELCDHFVSYDEPEKFSVIMQRVHDALDCQRWGYSVMWDHCGSDLCSYMGKVLEILSEITYD